MTDTKPYRPNVGIALFNAVVGTPDVPPHVYAELAENLAKLERYERRAFSRRKRALYLLTNPSYS